MERMKEKLPLRISGLANQNASSSGSSTLRYSAANGNKLNDSVFELYNPPDGAYDIDLVFIHGLNFEEFSEAHFSTWTTRDEKSVLWPGDWISEMIPTARILTVAYGASSQAKFRQDKRDVYVTAKRLLCDLTSVRVFEKSTVLVAHSLGALLVKAFCIVARLDEELRGMPLLQNVRGIFYFSPPHLGGQVIQLQMLTHLGILDVDFARLDTGFTEVAREFHWNIWTVAELYKTELEDGRSELLVSERSARGSATSQNTCFAVVSEDHITITRPRSKTSTSYVLLARFLMDVYEDFRHEKTVRLNNQVYELYNPPKGSHALDIILFHGLRLKSDESIELHLSTWTTGGVKKLLWPKHWLSKKFSYARILSVAYDGSLRKTYCQGRTDLYVTGESLLADLLLAGVFERPVIFVAHSFGALVVKQVCLLAHANDTSRARTKLPRLQSIRGIFYYSPSHLGSWFCPDNIEVGTEEGELLQHFRVLSKDVSRLNQAFNILPYEWRSMTVSETRQTDLGHGQFVLVVPEASAREFSGGAFIPLQGEDHISITRPRGKTSSSYIHLEQFLEPVYEDIMHQKNIIRERGYSEIDRPDDIQDLPWKHVCLDDRSTIRRKIREKMERHSVVGLWGMGGIGKTTLAKVIFNDLHSSFEYTLFATDVKSMKCDTKEDYQEKVLENLHNRGSKVMSKDHPPSSKFLKDKKFFFVLDDIDEERDPILIHKLSHLVSEESRFIVTSRESSSLLQIHGIEVILIPFLSHEDAEELIVGYVANSSALRGVQSSALALWQKNALKQIIKLCGGLPLSLEVIGRYLRGQGPRQDVWEATAETLSEGGNMAGMDKVWRSLQFSYDKLRPEEKQMFLDASTIFQESRGDVFHEFKSRKWSLGEAKSIWSSRFGKEVAIHWITLVNHALVYEGEADSPIRMHQHFRDLGHSLAQKETVELDLKNVNALRRFMERITPNWDELRLDAVVKRSGLVTSLTEHRHIWPVVFVENLYKLHKLQYLRLKNLELTGQEMKLPRDLRFLYLAMNLFQVWDGGNFSFAECNSVAVVRLDGYGAECLPDTFCDLKTLRYLEVRANFLECLPDRFHDLQGLRECQLSCTNITKLPDSFGKLENLTVLSLTAGKLFMRLPESFGCLRNLETLKLDCVSLKALPSSFPQLRSLRWFFLRSTKLENLPLSFGQLAELRFLNMTCSRLVSFPSSFCRLARVHEMQVDILPLRLSYISRRLGLHLVSRQLEDVDEKILTVLKVFTRRQQVCGNENLQHTSVDTIVVKELDVSGGGEQIPDLFAVFEHLRSLRIHNCPTLQRIPDSISHLTMLQTLEISSVPKLHGLPESLGSMRRLRRLSVHRCSYLLDLPESLAELTSLESLEIAVCSRLEALPSSLIKLTVLKDVYLADLPSLKYVPDLDSLPTQQRFNYSALPPGFKLPRVPPSCTIVYGAELGETRELVEQESDDDVEPRNTEEI